MTKQAARATAAAVRHHRAVMPALRDFAILFAAWASVLAPAAAARTSPAVEGIVTRVVDGDTLWLAVPGHAPRVVRLRDVDAPEVCQPWGAEARRALADLALNKTATLRAAARDVHGRTVGAVRVGDVDLGAWLVSEGHAWSTRTRWDRGPLVKQERMAKALGRGLHASPGAVAPAEFRRSHGPCAAPSPPR